MPFRAHLGPALQRRLRRLDVAMHPRVRFLFDHRAGNAAFGLLVIAGSLACDYGGTHD